MDEACFAAGLGASSLPFAVDVLCSFPFLTRLFLVYCFCFLFLFPDFESIRTARWSARRDQSFQLCITSGISNFNRRHFNGWEKRADSGAEWPSWNVRVGGSPWVGAWDGLGFTRRLDHLLSLLGVPVIFCLIPSLALVCGRGGRWRGDFHLVGGVVASVHCLFVALLLRAWLALLSLVIFVLGLSKSLFWLCFRVVVNHGLSHRPSLELCGLRWVSFLHRPFVHILLSTAVVGSATRVASRLEATTAS